MTFFTVGAKKIGLNLRISPKAIANRFLIRISFGLMMSSSFGVLPCCITKSDLFCSDKRTSGAATKPAKVDKKPSQELKNAGR